MPLKSVWRLLSKLAGGWPASVTKTCAQCGCSMPRSCVPQIASRTLLQPEKPSRCPPAVAPAQLVRMAAHVRDCQCSCVVRLKHLQQMHIIHLQCCSLHSKLKQQVLQPQMRSQSRCHMRQACHWSWWTLQSHLGQEQGWDMGRGAVMCLLPSTGGRLCIAAHVHMQDCCALHQRESLRRAGSPV